MVIINKGYIVKAIVKSSPAKGLEMVNKNKPANPKDDEVQVQVTHVGICGTDFHIYSWDHWAQNRIKPPLTTGHEMVGIIQKIGSSVEKYKVGQRVSVECHKVCGVCRYCRTGRGHLCAKTSIIGVDEDGVFAEYVNLPASNVWSVDDAIPNHHAAIFDPIGNAMHAVSKADVAGHSVLITGAGAIGLISIAIARSLGARHISVIEPQEYKRNLAKELGADIVMSPGDDAHQAILKATNGVGPHALIEMSGHPLGIDSGLDLLQPGGTAVMLGIPSDKIQFDLAEKVIFKGLTIKGIIGREMFNTWFQVESFMINNPEAVEKTVTHVLPFEEFERGFELMENGTCAKVVLKLVD
ncbi:MAG: L-threonine 3-dehydrogenase [Proteobacteria bacterium]|nr:MAG: L-threonine 3-dehydrogenase [Pseudomonadota bacterium]